MPETEKLEIKYVPFHDMPPEQKKDWEELVRWLTRVPDETKTPAKLS